MIVLDTTVLVYAVGEAHDLAEPCRRLIQEIGAGRVRATTSAEALQEFVHVRARRRTRRDAVALGRAYVELLSPLLAIDEDAVLGGLRLFERLPRLGAFDAILAAAAIRSEAQALISADGAFGGVHGLHWIDPASSALTKLLEGG